MAFYLRTWELDSNLRPHSPTVYTPDLALAYALEPIMEEQERPGGCSTWVTITNEVTFIGECALWGRVPKLHHRDPRSMSERHIAVELWGRMVTSPADLACETPKVWPYQVFPRLALKIPDNPPWDEASSPHTWIDPEDPLPASAQINAMPAAVYTTRLGHAWGSGPCPVALGDDGAPAPDAFDLAPDSPYLWTTVTMPPKQALAYTPDALWAREEDPRA